MTITEVFGDQGAKMKNKFVAFLLEEKKIDEFLDAIYSQGNKFQKLLTLALDFGKTNSFFGFGEQDFTQKVQALIGDDDFLDLFVLEIASKISSSENDTINSGIIGDLIALSCYWKLFSISIKKCLSKRHYTDTIDSSGLLKDDYDYTSGQIFAIKECVSHFNLDVNSFNFDNTKMLGLFLHEKFSYSRPKTQKKQIARVGRKAKRILIYYKMITSGKQRNYFGDGKHKVPGWFVDYIRKLYF